MNRDFRGGSSVPADDEAAALMRAIVERVSYARGVPTRGHANRELAEWVAQFSTKGEVELRKIHCDEIKAQRERERLEWLTQISARAEAELRQIRSAEAQQRRKREQLQWLAQISDGHERQLRALVAEEKGPTARPLRAVRRGLARARAWDASKHPRLGGPPNPGWWATRGGSSSASASHTMRSATRSIPYRPGQSGARGVTVSGTPSATWPAHAPSVPALPRVGSGAGAAAGVAAGGLLGGLRNASMSPYSARVPAARAMLDIWVYDLEKRVRAGQLSHDDAVGIFNIAVLGAKAQGFTPAGGTMSAVHNSALISSVRRRPYTLRERRSQVRGRVAPRLKNRQARSRSLQARLHLKQHLRPTRQNFGPCVGQRPKRTSRPARFGRRTSSTETTTRSTRAKRCRRSDCGTGRCGTMAGLRKNIEAESHA